MILYFYDEKSVISLLILSKLLFKKYIYYIPLGSLKVTILQYQIKSQLGGSNTAKSLYIQSINDYFLI